MSNANNIGLGSTTNSSSISSSSSAATATSIQQQNTNSQQLLATALSAITAALNPQLQQQHQSANFLTENLLSLLTSALVSTNAATNANAIASSTPTSPPASSTSHSLNNNNNNKIQNDHHNHHHHQRSISIDSLSDSLSPNHQSLNNFLNVNTDLTLNNTTAALSLPTPPSSASPSSSSSSASSMALFDSNLTAALAFNSNDFCTQYRKRIQQAQERLLQKQMLKQKTQENIGPKTSTTIDVDALRLQMVENSSSNKSDLYEQASSCLDNNSNRTDRNKNVLIFLII